MEKPKPPENRIVCDWCETEVKYGKRQCWCKFYAVAFPIALIAFVIIVTLVVMKV